MGAVITFYSYKGGVGRSMALANIGILLAKWGKKTLLIDWDLEAPGLENYFRHLIPDFPSVSRKEGLMDILHEKTTNSSFNVKSIAWSRYLTKIDFEGNSNLSILTSGRKDEEYVSKIRQFDFSSFYNKHDGGDFLEDIRTYWKQEFDYILIDSRTGLTDSSGVCSIQMPDVLVLLFTATEQGFQGTLNVAKKSTAKHKDLIYDRLKLKLLPIPTRFDNAELKLTEEWLHTFASELLFMYDDYIPRDKENNLLIHPSDILKKIKIPYISFFSYGEKLPVLEQGTDDPNSIGFVYETITSILANNFIDIQKLKDDRDLYLKMAKGEEVLDFTYFKKRISEEQEEKKKLEAMLKAQEEQINRQKKQSKVITYSVIGVAALALIIFLIVKFSNNSAGEQTTVSSEDSARTADSIGASESYRKMLDSTEAAVKVDSTKK